MTERLLSDIHSDDCNLFVYLFEKDGKFFIRVYNKRELVDCREVSVDEIWRFGSNIAERLAYWELEREEQNKENE